MTETVSRQIGATPRRVEVKTCKRKKLALSWVVVAGRIL
jgi:hypothetical protein